MRRVFALHLVVNAALIVLVYLWLGIRDAHAWQVVLTFTLGVVMVSAALHLHAGTWYWMRAGEWRVPRRTLLRCAAGLVIFAVAAWLLSFIPVERMGLWVASTFTFMSRKAVRPEMVQRLFSNLIWLLKWFVIPVILFGGWRRGRFWLLCAAVLLLSWYVPQGLVHWTPGFKSTAAEVASLAIRWSIAYVLCIAGWLLVLRESGRLRSAR